MATPGAVTDVPPSNEVAVDPTIKETSVPKKYKTSQWYYLVRFTKDGVLLVCASTELQYRRRIADRKIVTFGNFQKAFYQCKIIAKHRSKKYLLQEAFALNKRTKVCLSKRTMKSTQKFVLVKFSLTNDYQILPIDVTTAESDGSVSVGCPDGAQRHATLLVQGSYNEVFTKLQELQSFDELTTPEKKIRRNPLIPFTPRVKITPRKLDASPSCSYTVLSGTPGTSPVPNYFKRTLSMQSTKSEQSCSSSTIRSILHKTEDLQDDSFETEDEQDPFHTDNEGSEYFPSRETSPSPTLNPELQNSLRFIMSDEFMKDGEEENTVGELPSTTKEEILPSAGEEVPSIAGENVVQVRSSLATASTTVFRRKSNACFLCHRHFVRLSRHLETAHRNHPDVVKVVAISDKQERKAAWKKLLVLGNYEHNLAVLKGNPGEIIPQRRLLTNKPDKVDYYPCDNCKGFYKRQNLHKHYKLCQPGMKNYVRVQKRCRLTLPSSTITNKRGLSILVREVYAVMTDDETSLVARADELIVKYAADYCAINMLEPEKAYMGRNCSHNMRALGKLLIYLQEKHGKESTLQNFIRPDRFDDMMEAVFAACKFDQATGTFGTPSLGIKLMFLLKSCSLIVQSDASKMVHHEQYAAASQFLELMEKQYPRLVTTLARKQLRKDKFQKHQVLPLAEDVMEFVKYIQREEQQLSEKLSARFTYGLWTRLAKVLLCSLIVFNRKRVGDVDKILISSYRNRCDSTTSAAIHETLDTTERLTASSYCHFYTKGKKDSQVPVMIHKRQIPFIELLIHYRAAAGVAATNPFLFGKGRSTFLEGHHAMRFVSENSGVKNHQLFRSTILRKQIATMSQAMNMSPADLDVLATYLGHTSEVHKRFYRLPPEALHLARISKLLSLINSNNVDTIRGKSLEELVSNVDATTGIEYLQEDANEIGTDLTIEDDVDIEDYFDENDDVQPSTSKSKRTFTNNRNENREKTLLIRTSWSTAEREAVLKHFSVHVHEKIVPRKAEIDDCLAAEPTLTSRSWRNIKDFVRNMSSKGVPRKRKPRNVTLSQKNKKKKFDTVC